jgi:SAM-dependent methyltransferase
LFRRRFLHALAVMSEGKAKTSTHVIQLFADEVRKLSPAPSVVVVGGGDIGAGVKDLYSDQRIRVIASDIFVSDVTDLVCDGHFLPFRDGSFEGVLIQAVLEHVIEPQDVVSEIYRVLSSGGVVCAETPFMQQVHMAANDFHRFTYSGHRWLFRKFREIEAGVTDGAGRSLVWAIHYFLRALFRTDKFWLPLRIMLGWLGRIEALMDNARNRDAASGFYFVGAKCSDELHPKDMLAYYSRGRG